MFVDGRLPGGYLVPGAEEAVEPLSPEEEQLLAGVVKNGSPQEKEAAGNRLLLNNIRLLQSIAGRFYNRGLTPGELLNEGGVGLLAAAERFQPGKGARFSTYSVWRISQSIRRALARQGRIIRVPLHTLENLYRMRRLEREFKTIHGHVPDTGTLSRLMGCSAGIVAELKRVDAFAVTSIDAPKDDNELPLAEKLAGNEGNIPDRQYGEEENLALLARAFKELSVREKEVIAMRYGLRGMKTHSLQEIADIFCCSREAVRKIQTKAINKMKQFYDL